ncbi:Sialic acid transporter NanT [Paraburkholderia hiiakae]|uniref:Sialic acid transporter NanT n=1 Tax=Paraburkholderia hiiakae TaxID=1081782 RepID=A0ABN7IMB0_9BURK|nr:MFS transporter [Paraburkholderia hiiakae]CAD6562057.1 Sialic acid transporter NanT [Paraburkholderia hiiakae]
MKDSKDGWDTRYEWRVVALLAIGFGLVTADRFLIMPLFPVMMKDMGLDYRDLGYLTGILSVAWGLSAMFTGRFSDRYGHRKVIIPALLAFSLLVGTSGLAGGVASLLTIRALMGFAEGAYAPACITATLNASRPNRHGLNIGLQQAAGPLFGLCLAPIVVMQLLRWVPWHAVFAIMAVPGFVLAFLMGRVLRNTDPEAPDAQSHAASTGASQSAWREVLRYRNVRLGMLAMLCWMMAITVIGAFLPNYLSDYLHLDLSQIGYVLSAIGAGGALGTAVMPALSDRFGRKPVMVVSVFGALVSFVVFARSGANVTLLYGLMFAAVFCLMSLTTLTVGPASTESVPPHLATAASGSVIGIGEIFGGGIAPAIGGHFAVHFGIQCIPYLAIGAMGAGLLIVLALRETAPAQIESVAATNVA